MTLDNMTGITKGSYTGCALFCKSQLITCNRVKECNGVCPFEDALKHADKGMNEQTVIDHDRDWIIGCIKHDGFIKTDRFDKANQIILEALSADDVHGWIPCSERLPEEDKDVLVTVYFKGLEQRHKTGWNDHIKPNYYVEVASQMDGEWHSFSDEYKVARNRHEVVAWMPLPKPYREESEVEE